MGERSNLPGRRRYRMTRRHDAMQETRDRITAAAFDLHATIGPSRTTVRAIAERAGVQRHTVYAHFPDLEALYLACTEHGIRATSMPVPEGWVRIEDPEERLRHGLAELYAWFRANARMLTMVLADTDPATPDGVEPDPFQARMERISAVLVAGWLDERHPASEVLGAVVRHAIGFETWRSLTGSGLTDDRAVGLLVAVARGVADGAIDP